MTRKILITLFAIASILSFEAGFAAAEAPAVLGLKDQARVVDGWLKVRLDTVLPELMRREKLDMWLVVCEEYNEDPVYLTLVPFEDLSARRLSMLVFYDRGEGQGIEKVAGQPLRHRGPLQVGLGPGETARIIGSAWPRSSRKDTRRGGDGWDHQG